MIPKTRLAYTVRMGVDLLYTDDDLLAVNKPSGQVVHRWRGRAEKTLVDDVRAYLQVGTVYPVHRLDRGTSGVVLFARSGELAAVLNDRFAAGEVHKTYLALVRGVPPPAGEIDHPISRRDGGPRVEARTDFRLLASRDLEPRTLSLVEARPRSGRLHQVRRHLKHISHPVIGDANYGNGALNRAVAAAYGLRRLALHASRLALTHPRRDRELVIEAPLPSSLSASLERMGFEVP